MKIFPLFFSITFFLATPILHGMGETSRLFSFSNWLEKKFGHHIGVGIVEGVQTKLLTNDFEKKLNSFVSKTVVKIVSGSVFIHGNKVFSSGVSASNPKIKQQGKREMLGAAAAFILSTNLPQKSITLIKEKFKKENRVNKSLSENS